MTIAVKALSYSNSQFLRLIAEMLRQKFSARTSVSAGRSFYPVNHFRQVSIVLSRKKPPQECHCRCAGGRDVRGMRSSNFSTFFRLSGPSGCSKVSLALATYPRTNKRCVNCTPFEICDCPQEMQTRRRW